MPRIFAAAVLLCCLATSAWSQSPLHPTGVSPATPAKPVAKKPPSKPSVAARPTIPANNGPCKIGVIPAVGDLFMVEKFGLTVFGNEHDEVITNWGFDDLIFTRVRAAAGAALPIRR